MVGNDPFLKWAGGKRWLVKNHAWMFPAFQGTYFEPFLGSGAVFFHIEPRVAVLSDCNGELIETYCVVRDLPNALFQRLSEMHKLHDRKYYYEMRGSVPSTRLERAARFIYLNRTCWNGLYRVNRNGEFNVPIGSKTDVEISRDALIRVGVALKDAELRNVDFEVTIDRAKRGDFVYVDPPYTVSHNNNGFIKYNDVIFLWKDQVRLAEAVRRASQRGAYIFVSNAKHAELNILYSSFANQHTLLRASVLSGKPSGRKRTEEAAFLNYAIEP